MFPRHPARLALLAALLVALPVRAEEATPAGPAIAGYSIAGPLSEPEADLRPLLDTVLVNQPWDPARERELVDLLIRLQYDVRIETHDAAGAVRLTLNLQRFPVVRTVEISGNYPIPEDEIRRRLRLRPGVPLATDEAVRAAQLLEEEVRLTEYLAKRGWFDARVSVTAEPRGHGELKLVVSLVKGPAYAVGDVVVDGTTALPASEVVEVIRHRSAWRRFWCWTTLSKTCTFSYDRLKGDLESLRVRYQRLGYPGVRLRSDFDLGRSSDPLTKRVNLKITVNERRRVEVAFEGNQAIGDRELADALTLQSEGAYDDAEVERSAEAIRRYYQTRGYFQTIVASERQRPHADLDRIVFLVDEGPKLRVRSIAFAGNTSLAAGRLRGVIQTREFPKLALGSGGYATSTQLAQDVEAIANLYRTEGFAEAAADVHVAVLPELLDSVGAQAAAALALDVARGLYIRFDVVEGPRTVVSRVDFQGNVAPVVDADLARVARLRPGAPFYAPQLEDDASALVRHFRQRGFAYARVIPRPPVDLGDHKVAVVFEIQQGDAVEIGKVLIRGNFLTRSWVIREALGLAEGDLLTLARLENAQQGLRATDLFSAIHPDFVGLDRGANPVHMIVDVQERHDYWLDTEASAGYTTDHGIFGSVTGQHRNIAGVGISSALQGEVNQGSIVGGTGHLYRVSATAGIPRWVLRHALHIPLRLDLTSRWRNETTTRFTDLVTYGGSGVFSHQLRPGVQVNARYDYNHYDHPVPLVRPAGIHQDITSIPITTTTSSIGFGLIYDGRRDANGMPNPLAPVRGAFFAASALWASSRFGSSDDFIKLSVNWHQYWQLGKRVVLRNAIRWDHGIPAPFDTSPTRPTLLPDVERFTAGGDTTVRGFEEDRLKTEVIRNPVAPIDLGGDQVYQLETVAAGGNIRVLHTLDLQVQVWDLGFPVASAIFLDTGLVTNSFYSFKLTDFRHSVGIAFFRWVMPFAQISFEYAVPLDPGPGDDPTGRFHLNIGATLQ